MRSLTFGLAMLAAISGVARAGKVHHGDPSGIIASESIGSEDHFYVLTSLGEVWVIADNLTEWENIGQFGLAWYPMPVSDVAWWGVRVLVTNSGEGWRYLDNPPRWESLGGIPTSDTEETFPEPTTARVRPNPVRGHCEVVFSQRSSGTSSVEIFDVNGRKIRVLFNGEQVAGMYAPMWDGKDDAGLNAASGIYLVRVATPDEHSSRRIVLAR